MNSIITRIATNKDLKNIVDVHKKCFPNSFTSLWPENLLAAYYKEYLNEDKLFIVAENNDGLLIGFCMGYKIGTTAQRNFFRKNTIQLFNTTTKLLLKFNSLAINSFTSFVLSKLGKANVQSIAAQGDLLSICVVDGWKGTSCAAQMLQHFEQLLMERSIKNYTLYVHSNNERAIHFYKKCGLSVTMRYDRKKYSSHVHEYSLQMFKQLL